MKAKTIRWTVGAIAAAGSTLSVMLLTGSLAWGLLACVAVQSYGFFCFMDGLGVLVDRDKS